MLGLLLALGALVCGIALLFGIALGELTPHLVGLGITLLALALLIGPAITYVRARG
jgi:hypothetical protein